MIHEPIKYKDSLIHMRDVNANWDENPNGVIAVVNQSIKVKPCSLSIITNTFQTFCYIQNVMPNKQTNKPFLLI